MHSAHFAVCSQSYSMQWTVCSSHKFPYHLVIRSLWCKVCKSHAASIPNWLFHLYRMNMPTAIGTKWPNFENDITKNAIVSIVVSNKWSFFTYSLISAGRLYACIGVCVAYLDFYIFFQSHVTVSLNLYALPSSILTAKFLLLL